jgi:hypothetical protein
VILKNVAYTRSRGLTQDDDSLRSIIAAIAFEAASLAISGGQSPEVGRLMRCADAAGETPH